MRIPEKIFISEKANKVLEKKNLIEQFIKAKNNILKGNISGGTQFSRKEPKEEGARYFRINKQFRALCHFSDKNILFVTHIDNHQ